MAQPLRVLGLEIATLGFHVVGMADPGPVGLRTRMARGAWLPVLATLPPARLGMEAGGRAPSWARRVHAPGHEGRLIAPPSVNACVKPPQHATRDAAALGEAGTRPPLRLVPIHPRAPQESQAPQRIRARLSKARTALGHAIRGLLRASGMVLPPGMAQGPPSVVRPREDAQAKLPPLSTEGVWPL